MAEAAVAIVIKRSLSITPTRMRLAEYDRQEWIVNAELSTTAEDLLKPEYWAHMAEQMKPYDHIEVRAEDDAWIATLIVRRVERSAVIVHLTSFIEFDSSMPMPQINAKHDVQWKGPQRKFAVIRLVDKEIIKEDFGSRDDAARWMREYEKTTG